MSLRRSSYLARFMTSARRSQLSTFANKISSISEAVATGIGCAASGYKPVRTPFKVAMVLAKLVVLPLTAPSCHHFQCMCGLDYCKAHCEEAERWSHDNVVSCCRVASSCEQDMLALAAMSSQRTKQGAIPGIS